MGSAKKKARQRSSFGSPLPNAASGSGRRNRRFSPFPETSSPLSTTASTGAYMYPFGGTGPGLEAQRRQRPLWYQATFGAWLLFSLSSLIALSDGMRFHMLSHWSYLVATLFGIVAFLGYLGAHALEGWILFWGLFMVHGLLWCQLLCIYMYGTSPSVLWREEREHAGDRLLMSALGSAGLLFQPLLFLYGYCYMERNYLSVVFYDFWNQLRPEHRRLNVLWHLFSPILPLAAWGYFCNPRVYTDMPRWPGSLAISAVCALCNGLGVYVMERSAACHLGPVKWCADAWAVWNKPAQRS